MSHAWTASTLVMPARPKPSSAAAFSAFSCEREPITTDRPALARRRAIGENFEAANLAALRSYQGERARIYAELKLAGLREAPIHLAVFCDEATELGHGLGVGLYESPMIERAERSLAASGAGTVVGIDYKDVSSQALGFIATHGLSYPNLRDITGSFATAYGTDALPETFVLDRRERVVALWRGPVPSEAALKQAIALAERT